MKQLLVLSVLISLISSVISSMTPTESPSAPPSPLPSPSPTVQPTITPTVNPTIHPTVIPTVNPTINPSQAPTIQPTIEPSEEPTVAPTIAPTPTPTQQRTSGPTYTLSTNAVYTLDTSDAYTWKYGYPQSCECVENDVTKKDCSLFKCLCSCDVNAGQCDYGCCCDPDCSSDQVSRFKELDVCAFMGFTAASVEYCYNTNELYAVNPRSPLGGQSTSKDAVSSALCVVKTNYASQGHYFKDTDLQSSSIFGEEEGQKDYSYIPSPPTDLSPDKFFDQNDSIAAFYFDTTTGLISNGPGYFPLPQADFSGACNDNNYVTFENDIKSAECLREVSRTEDIFVSQCVSQSSVSRYVNSLRVARTPLVSAATGSAVVTDVVNVTLSSVYYQDFTTGEVLDVTAAWFAAQCETVALLNSSASFSDTIQNGLCSFASPSTKTVLMDSGAVCSGFISGVSYTVNHAIDATSSISGVSAKIIVTDIPINLNGASVGVTQSFGVKFFSAYTGDVNADNGNIVKRQRSGNPGYIMGLPVLYGFLDSDDSTVVDELIEGLSVPTAIMSFDPNFPDTFGKAVCPSEGQIISTTPLNFGYDMVTGCTIDLTRQELINLCCQGSSACAVGSSTGTSPYSDSTTGIPYYLAFTQGYVGIYGDADPLDVTQWSEISYSDPLPTRIWNEKTSTCSGMYSGINLKFLIASSGEKMNPQNKIVSALAELITSDWVFNIPTGDDSSTQTFPLSTTVTYVMDAENKFRSYEPPAPPVLFHVPYDVFYPILKSQNAAPRSASIGLGLTAIGIVICSMVVGFLM